LHTTDDIPVLGFAARSGTGKTTLLTYIIPLLNAAGIRIGLIKHTHHDVDIDQPGKDSFRLRQAGATPVVLISTHRRAVITEIESDDEPLLSDQLSSFSALTTDLIIVEGFKHESFPKIELHRKELANPFLFQTDPSVIAIASNDSVIGCELPVLDINNPDNVADFIINDFIN